MIEQDFKYFVNSYIIQNLMYFINLKVEANCDQCHRGLDLDPSRDCFTIDYKYHERADLLFYFNDAFFATLEVLNLEPYLLDIQKTISVNLLKLKYEGAKLLTSTHWLTSSQLLEARNLLSGALTIYGARIRTKLWR